MKLSNILVGAGIALSSLTVAAPAPAQGISVTVGDPGVGWSRWHGRRYDRSWDGPRWYNQRGPHYGWYNWNNNYYQNCSWRYGRRHNREWRCW
ncbi:MAG TPA: hypothetical protein VGF77_12850 [Allosphingosinicella sp.]|jgi:hypothetical protein